MLPTQVQYWTLQETKRHNIETELQGQQNIAENVRHNREVESQQWFGLQETQRHNIAFENETQRHNQATEGISFANLQELIRHNYATEAVQAKQADAAMRQAQASAVQANAAMMNAATNRWNAGVQASVADTVKRLNIATAKSRKSEAKYNAARTKAENISNRYGNIRETTGIAESLTRSFQNITHGAKDLTYVIGKSKF